MFFIAIVHSRHKHFNYNILIIGNFLRNNRQMSAKNHKRSTKVARMSIESKEMIISSCDLNQFSNEINCHLSLPGLIGFLFDLCWSR